MKMTCLTAGRWLLCLLMTTLSWQHAQATFDMNIHELQYVADHLTEVQCRELSSALRQDTVLLSTALVNATAEPHVSCITLLIQWDRQKGRGTSFQRLATRLNELGHEKIAGKLSQTVYGEKVDAVQEVFFDKPLEASVNIESPLLADAPQTKIDQSLPGKPSSSLTGFQILGVVGGAMCLTVILCYVARDSDLCVKWRALATQHLLGKRPAKPAYQPTASEDLENITFVDLPTKEEEKRMKKRKELSGLDPTTPMISRSELAFGEEKDSAMQDFLGYISKL